MHFEYKSVTLAINVWRIMLPFMLRMIAIAHADATQPT